MSYSTISTWETETWDEELIKIAKEKYVPLIMSAGAESVRMVRTGDLSFCVVTNYANADAAETAQAKIAETRAEASEEINMTMVSAVAGELFASS